jgi:uncharacterized membrane protein
VTQASPTTQRSEPGLDLYRAFVVVMMFIVHTKRLQPRAEPTIVERSLRFFMWTEPYIAASFLFIAGVSLALAHEKAGVSVAGKVLWRALGLYLLAVALFVPQYGPELPDLIASPGILSAIALAIAVGSLALASPSPDLALCLAGAAVWSITAWLDHSGTTVPGLNAGPGGAFPIVVFTLIGALIWRVWRRSGGRGLGVISAVSAGLFVGVLAIDSSWITERASMYRVHGGQLALFDLGSNAARAPVRFWNHSAVGTLGLILPLTLSLGAWLVVGRRLAGSRVIAPCLLLGRHALAAYVAHLGLLGVAELSGLSPSTPARTWVVVATLTATSLAVAWAIELRRAGTRPGTPPADRPASGTGADRSPRRQT